MIFFKNIISKLFYLKNTSISISNFYYFVTTGLKNNPVFKPVSGVPCPTCGAKGENVWVTPGEDCPKCGTHCSSLMLLSIMVVVVVTSVILSIIIMLVYITFDLSNGTLVLDTNGKIIEKTVNLNNKCYHLENSYSYLLSSSMCWDIIDNDAQFIDNISYTTYGDLSSENNQNISSSENNQNNSSSENSQNNSSCENSQNNSISENIQNNSYSENIKSNESIVATIFSGDTSEIAKESSKGDKESSEISEQSTIKSGELCEQCYKRGYNIYIMPGELCSELGHVDEDESGYENDDEDETDSNEMSMCWHCLTQDIEISLSTNETCPNCGTPCNTDAYGPWRSGSPLFQFVIFKQVTIVVLSTLILSITNMGIYSILSGVFILTLIALCNNNGRLLSNKTNNSQESVYMTVYNIVINQIDYFRGQWYFPFLYAIFVFIVINNIVGMIPYSFSTTAHFILTFFLSIVVVFGSTILGLFIHIFKFFSILVPENCPLPLLCLLVFIESISYIARNISLGLRLAANVLSGHMLLNILSGFVHKISKNGFFSTLADSIPSGFVTVFSALEIGIAFIQAQVFSVLSGSYIKDGVNLH